jgi:hypothetical protein
MVLAAQPTATAGVAPSAASVAPAVAVGCAARTIRAQAIIDEA